MSDVLDYVPEEDRRWADIDTALILDEALDLYPLDDREVPLDDEYRADS